MAGVAASVSLDGLRGQPVEVEVDVGGGLPRTTLVGLADASVNEAKNRCRSAVANSGITWPDQLVTINLAPSAVPKSGSHYDLAIAVAVVAAKELIAPPALRGVAFLGELALDGRLRAMRGVLPATLVAAESGFRTVFVPEVNLPEAELVPGIDVVGVRSLRQVIARLTGGAEPDDPPVPHVPDGAGFEWAASRRVAHLDLADVAGQADARIALVVAAAGGHHLLLAGPPGVGKTMLAQRLPGLLPDLDPEASLETSAVHSLAGVLPADSPMVERPPFVDPHHTASAISIVGGGTRSIRPGAMSLAHNGVLFMDEAPEFASNVLDALRQPLESGQIVVSRAYQTAVFPARFQLVLAANPCPCGEYGSLTGACRCTPVMRRRYQDRLSGPVRDRVDIQRTLAPPTRPGLAAALGDSVRTAALAARVAEARDRQAKRFAGTPWRTNAAVSGVEFRKNWPLQGEAREQLDATSRTLNARSVDRIVRLAWSVADLAGRDAPQESDVRTACALRGGGPIEEAVW